MRWCQSIQVPRLEWIKIGEGREGAASPKGFEAKEEFLLDLVEDRKSERACCRMVNNLICE